MQPGPVQGSVPLGRFFIRSEENAGILNEIPTISFNPPKEGVDAEDDCALEYKILSKQILWNRSVLFIESNRSLGWRSDEILNTSARASSIQSYKCSKVHSPSSPSRAIFAPFQ
jgi:hypothetical protein